MVGSHCSFSFSHGVYGLAGRWLWFTVDNQQNVRHDGNRRFEAGESKLSLSIEKM